MIFNELEIYLLSASPATRWRITLLTLSTLVVGWWYYAYNPLHARIAALQASSLGALTVAQHSQDHVVPKHDYHHALKKLIADGLTIEKVTVESDERNADMRITRIKIEFTGSFEKLYAWLKDCSQHYTCSWHSCVCAQADDGRLLFEAEITLYSR